MSEIFGSFSFEDEGVFNPYDRNLHAKSLANDCVATFKNLIQLRFEQQGSVSVQPSLEDDRVVLAEELMIELVNEIEDRGIEVADPLLRDYINTPQLTIDDEQYDPTQDVSWYTILKACGFPKELIKNSYDMSNSSLPQEHMYKNDLRMKVIDQVYGDEE